MTGIDDAEAQQQLGAEVFPDQRAPLLAVNQVSRDVPLLALKLADEVLGIGLGERRRKLAHLPEV